MSRLPRQSGTTLVEVVIASVILAALVAMAMMVMMTASDTANEATITGDLENRSRQMLERLRSQFMTARFRDSSIMPATLDGMGLYLNNCLLKYQVPVNVQADGVLRYGYSTKIGLSEEVGFGKFCVLRYEAETVIRESVNAPSTAQAADGPVATLPAQPALVEDEIRNFDINKDGDLRDTFVRGKIMQYILFSDDTVETENILADNVLLAVRGSGDFRGDFDNNATTSELLFRYVKSDGDTWVDPHPNETEGRALAINVFFGGYTNDGKSFHVRRASETIRFKNRQ